MSRDIEERVVAMKLQNSQFESNAKQTLGTLGKLAESLKFNGAAKGLQGISAAAKNTNLGPLSSAVGNVSRGFSAMSVIGVTALATIANKAVNVGLNLVKSLTLAPLKSGFDEYELKMGSIQTILANTARYGTKLPEVTKNLEELNEYADKTIYNFGDMTKNIGLFTNAGIKVGDATKMIKGFSNAAAASGTSAQGAASAAYQLSQALSAGKITLMDWRSLQNVGMGNKNMQKSIIDIALAMGTLKKGTKTYTKVQTDFNGSLKDGWLEAEVMSKYLQIMAEDNVKLNKAQLKGIGITGKRADAFIKEQKMAQEAATKVRTFSQLLGTVRESIGSGWSTTFEIVIGNFTTATSLWTSINDSLGKTLGQMSDARNLMLIDWAKFGGRTALIDGLRNAWQAVAIILKSVKDAWRSVFPATTGKQLAEMTKTFRAFTAGLKMGGENADRLKRTFAGLFSILKVGYTIVKFVATTLLDLFGIAQGGSGGILALTAAAGDFLVSIEKWLTTNGKIKQFFSTIDTARVAIIVPLVAIFGDLAEAIGSLLSGDLDGFKTKMQEAFTGIGPLLDGIWKSLTSQVRSTLANLRDMTGIAGEFLKSLGISALEPIQKMLAKLSDNFSKLRDLIQNFGFDAFRVGTESASSGMSKMNDLGEKIRAVWAGIKEALMAVKTFLGPVADSIGGLFTAISDKLTEFITNLNLNDVAALVNTGMFIMLYKSIRDFTKNLDGMVNTFSGIGGDIKDVLSTIKTSVTDTLKTMQQDVKSNIILKIAIAIGILALSLKLLSTIEPAKLATAVTAVGVMLFALTKTLGSMLDMMKVVEGQAPTSAVKMLAAGGAIMLLAGAVLILSFAVKNLSGLSWQEMAKGLIATGALLAGLALFTKFAEMDKGSLKAGANLVLLAGAIYLLSFSVSKLGEMDQNALIQGAVAVQSILATLAMVSQVMGDTKSMKGAASIIIMAGALAILTPVIIALGFVPFENLARGLGTLAIALVGMAAVARLMGDQKSIKGAAGIALMAAALAVLTPALIALGMIPVDTLIQGLAGVAVALVLFAGASRAMGDPKSLLGAASILAMAFALQALAPVILLLGQADLTTLALGLGAIAVGFGILIAAGALAGMVAPGLAALSLTLLAIGAAMVLAGVGMAAFAAGFATLVAIGTAGFAVLTIGFTGLINLIPLMAQQVGLGLIAIAVVISQAGPRIVDAIATVLISFLKAIERAAPQFFSTMATLIMGLVRTIERLVPQIAAAGARMLIRLLNVIGTYVGPMADAATRLMINFINAIARNVPKLVDAGMKAIIKFINGLTTAIDNNSEEMGRAGGRLAAAIVRGMVNGIGAGIDQITSAARNLASSALNAAKNFLGIRSPSREFAKLGAFSAKGFVVGLDGGKAEITKSVSDLQTMIKAAQKNATEDVKTLQKKLNHLKRYHRRDKAEIAATTRALAAARSELSKANKAWAVSRSHGDELRTLQKLADKQALNNKRIVEGTKALEDAKKARDDYAKSTADQYDNLTSVSAETKLTDYVKDMQKQIVDTQLFTAQLAQLRKMGLNEAMYRELLGKGAEAMPFAQQILEGGQTSVDELNVLGSSLSKAAIGIGNQASKDLYQAGVDVAAGLIKGIQSQNAAIEKQMDAIAKGMVSSIKKALGIRSPSRAFMEVGDWSAKGLAAGFKNASDLPNKAAAEIGHGTIEALRKSLTGLEKVVASEIEIDPTIRPVLDLSAIKRDSVKMGAMLDGGTVSVASVLARARATAAERSANRDSRDELAMAGSGDTYILNQTNNSPKALSDATIYRNTKNLISTAKGAGTR